jgi:hypothetical protein
MTLQDLNGKLTVNKQIALEIKALTNDQLQRRRDPKKVMKYATQMKANNWTDRGETLVITKEGKMLDGGHRLEAVIEADAEVTFRFINDVEEVQNNREIFLEIDTHTRKAHDVLSIEYRDLLHTKEVTALIAQLESFALNDLYQTPNGKPLKNQTVLEIAQKHRPIATLDTMAERGHVLSNRSGTVKGNSVRNKLITPKEAILLTATVGTCDRGNDFLEQLVELTQVDSTVLNKRNGHALDPLDPMSKLVIQLNNITDSDKKYKNARRYAVLFDAYDQLVSEAQHTDKKLIESRIIYPLDYANYTEV